MPKLSTGHETAHPSLEDKLKELEEKFASLETKYNEVKAKVEKEDTSTVKSPKTDDANDSKADGDSAAPVVDGSVRIVINRYDKDSGERKDYEAYDLPPETTTRTEKYSSLLRKFVGDDPDGELVLYDADLIDFLRSTLAHYPNFHFSEAPDFIMSPYPILVRNWDLLWSEAEKPGKDEKDTKTRLDLREMLQAILAGSGELRLDGYFLLRDGLKKQSTITFETLWTIFIPGQIVYSQIFFKQHQIFMVESTPRLWPPENLSRRSRNPVYYIVRCWTYDFTGSTFERRSVDIAIEAFDGAKPITTLSVFPFESGETGWRNTVRKTLLARGRRCRELCTLSDDERMHLYTGDAIIESQGFSGSGIPPARLYDSDSDDGRAPPIVQTQKIIPLSNSNVMIDFESYNRYSSALPMIGDSYVNDDIDECRCDVCENNKALKDTFKPHYDGMTGSKDEEWEDLQIMLCPPRVLGYVLKEKRWAQLAIDFVQEIPDESYDQVMGRLHLVGENGGEEIKELLYGLVKHHGGGTANRDNKSYVVDDIVADKGKGLVFLLYGDPGVGKTSTAQMLARAAKKPLFSIGVADIGTRAKQVESNLETIFSLATKWRAILLIDEADVFLQSRSQGPLGPTAEGSALVSVFLRVLEYFQGIMILTTNQIAQFDVAVQSRVNIALKFERLDKVQTIEIFMGFVNQYQKFRLVEGYDDFKKYAERDLVRKGFDGRQIRNIVTSAMGYARGLDRERMNIEHIRHVVRYVEDFKQDLAGQMMKWQDQQKSARLQ